MKPKKSLGQHWLHDESALDAIVDAARIAPGQTILEIGPGLGTLTAKLAKKAEKVVAVEIDDTLIEGLRHGAPANVEIVHGDILQFDLSAMPAGFAVVANVPYYITSKIIKALSESTHPPSRIVLLVQKEVAERICATPGSMSILAVAAQVYHTAYLGPEVPAYLFTPPPKVDSQVVVLERRESPSLYSADEKEFFRVVRAGFGEKRKKLRSSLSGGLGMAKERADALLEMADISPDARAQELTLEQWSSIAKSLAILEV